MTAGVCYPASHLSNTYIASVADLFLGVSFDESLNDDNFDSVNNQQVVVGTSGFYEFPCSYVSSLTVSSFANACQGVNSIESQKVEISQTASRDAIGLIVQADTRARDCLLAIQSKILNWGTDTNFSK